MKRTPHLIIYFVIITILLSATVQGVILSVGNNQYDYNNITAAIDASRPGDLINVNSGIYNENVEINKTNLTMKGVGETKSVVKRLSLLADGITLEGFEVKDNLSGLVYIKSKNNKLKNNSMTKIKIGTIPISSQLREVTEWLLSDPFIYQGMPKIKEKERALDPKNYEIKNNYIDSSNLVNGRPIYFLVNISDRILGNLSNAGSIYCFDCRNITIERLFAGQYVYFINTSNSKIAHNNIGKIFLQKSNNNSIEFNNFTGDKNQAIGVDLFYSNNNKIRKNYINNSFSDCIGIKLSLSTNNSLEGNLIDGIKVNTEDYHYQYGIVLAFSSNNTLVSNIASNNSRIGILLAYSGNNKLRNNTMIGNTFNFGTRGESNDIDLSNTVDGMPIYYLEDVSGKAIDSGSNAGTIYCINCNNITIANQTLKNNLYGVYLYGTENAKIENNNVSNNSIWIIYTDSTITFGNNNIYNNHNTLSVSDDLDTWNWSTNNPRFVLAPCSECSMDAHVSIPIASKPKKAEIWIDGEFTGYKTDHDIIFNDMDDHTINLKKTGYNPQEIEFNVNDTYQIDVQLTKLKEES